jgi:predicted ATPase
MCQLNNIVKAIGVEEFLIAENAYSFSNQGKIVSKKKEAFKLIKYLKEERLSPDEMEILKSFEKKEKAPKNENDPYYIFFHESGRIIGYNEYEKLMREII